MINWQWSINCKCTNSIRIQTNIEPNLRVKEWHKSLDDIEYAINNTVNRATGETPSKLLFGVSQRGYVHDALIEYVEEQTEPEERNLEQVRARAVKKME